LDDFNGRLTKDGIRIHGPEDFAGMHAAGRIAADILDRVAPHGRSGRDHRGARRGHRTDGGRCGRDLGHHRVSRLSARQLHQVNHVVCHGIPGGKVLKAGTS
jgi:methionyl aminopeptidase